MSSETPCVVGQTGKILDIQASTGGTIPFPQLFTARMTLGEAGMSVLESTEDFSIISVGGTAVRDIVTERAPDAVNRSHSETDEVTQTSICARIIEVLNGRETSLGGDYHFEQLPVPNDQIIILNRQRSYDIMRALYSAREPETTVYVRWVARK